MTKFVTSSDVKAFARQFQEVCEGQPVANYPVLLREHLIQRCRVASRGRTTIASAQHICREVCLAMLAFQSPLVGLLDGNAIVQHVAPGDARDHLVKMAGGEGPLGQAVLLVFDDDFTTIDWSYVDALTDAEVLLVGTADASELISMMMALTLSECGKRNNTTLYRGQRRNACKTTILYTPPLGPRKDAASWRYNTEDDTHFWIGGTHQSVGIDGACFEYMPGRTSIFMWTGEHADYEVCGSEPCTVDLANKMLDRLKQMLGTVQFHIMDAWSTTSMADD